MTRATLLSTLVLVASLTAACEQPGTVVVPSYVPTSAIDAEQAALRERANQEAPPG